MHSDFADEVTRQSEDFVKHHSRPLRMLALFLVCTLGVIVAFRTVGHANGFVLLWPLTGLELAMLLPQWRAGWRNRLPMQAMGMTGVLTGGLLMGMPWAFAMQIASLNFVDVWIAGFILSPGVRCFDDLKQQKNVYRFGLAATVAPLLVGVPASFIVSYFLHQSLLRTATLSTLADSLGLVLILPATLFVLSGEYRSLRKLAPHFKVIAWSMSLFIVVVIAVFRQNVGPFLFVVFPPMMMVLLALGLEGAVLTSLAITVIGWSATSRGYGPIWLMRGAGPEQRMLALQVFIWVCVATAMPVGALLDERRREERRAREAKSIYQTLLQNAQDTIILSSMDGSQRYASPGIEKLTGWTPDEYLALDRIHTFHPDDQQIALMILLRLAAGKREHTERYRIMQKDGGWKWVEVMVRAYGSEEDGEIAGYVGTIRDISLLKQAEDAWALELTTLTEERERMAGLASLDPLTGLANRRVFDELMQQQQRTKKSVKLAVMMIDVDFFKLYNDTYGHQAGDECLRQLAGVLQDKVGRETDLVARLGGEEFAVVLPGATAAGGLKVAEAILEGVRALQMTHGATVLGIVTVSVGVAAWDSHIALDPTLLIQQADSALYVSKRTGKNRASVSEANAMTMLSVS